MRFLKLRLFFISLLLLFCCTGLSNAQTTVGFQFYLQDTTHLTEFNPYAVSFQKKKNILDISKARIEIVAMIADLRSKGYLSASCDSLYKDGNVIHADFYMGEKMLWGNLSKGNVDNTFLDGTSLREKAFSKKPLYFEKVGRVMNTILKNCENLGYPFASIRLDSIIVNDQLYSAKLNLEKNKFVTIDSIIIKGSATVAPVYIYNYISINPGSVYNESQLKKIPSRMKELAFISEIKPSQLVFGDKETKLYLFLENKKASQFDGVIGLQPDENKTGKVNLTGEVHLKLQNSLRHGEIIEFNWKQLTSQSQDLKVHFLYPFILSTHFGVDGSLAIFKKDSTYIDVTKTFGVQYALTGNNYIKAFVNDKESDLQSTQGLEFATTLPSYADITILSYGSTVHYEKLDYRLNPRKGIALEFTASAGNRKIRKNSSINPALYDSLKMQSVTYSGEVHADYYWSPGGKHVIDFGTIAGYLQNESLFTNELFRLGGLKTLRGFDEESIYTSSFMIGKIEYRYQLEQNSFLFTFFNLAKYSNKSRHVNLHDSPFGFGAGINFETKLGIMSISYALGKQFDNPIYFRNGKIHFGIVNYF